MAASIDDLKLVEDIRRDLVASHEIDPAVVSVAADGGRVRLRGRVRTHAERVAIASRVAATQGVRGVDNFLTVRDIALDAADLPDAEIATAVKKAVTETTVPIADLHLAVSQNVVSIQGSVATHHERAAVRHAIHRTPGVHFVNDDLHVKGTPKSVVDELDPAECFRLLGRRGIGRLAVQDQAGVDIFPVNYLVHENEIFYKSAPGTKMIRVTDAPQVAFEVDGHDLRRAWSVVIKGIASRVDRDDEIVASGIDKAPTALPTEKLNYVRIGPQRITGRRFPRSKFSL
jgi:osmotically-inducible protein OsmY/nitroimidazol reductase NimA-like FMN-containing flavoprotein (pyridoxamine 5'-phosphate oxidase superfamily)